jgi:YD repeat-containing protein
MGHRSRTDRRRAQLARRAALETIESRVMITESLGIFLAGIGVAVGGRQPAVADVEGFAGGSVLGRRRDQWEQARPGRRHGTEEPGSEVSRSARPRPDVPEDPHVRPSKLDWLSLARTGGGPAHGATAPQAPSHPAGQGTGDSGASSSSSHGAITPLRLSGRPGTTTAASTGVAATAPVLFSGATPGPLVSHPGPGAPPFLEPIPDSSAMTLFASPPATIPTQAPAIAAPAMKPTHSLDPSGDADSFSALSFTSFPLYTLDYNNGIVLVSGGTQLALLGTSVDLRAQVRDVAVQSYSWNTSNLGTEASGISGTNTYRLTFSWSGVSVPQPTTRSVTLTVTDTNNHTEIQTYYFYLPVQSGSISGSTPTWPGSLAPDTVVPDGPAFGSHYVDVQTNTGALETELVLPNYSPNFAPLTLQYDSLAADPRPIVVVHHELPSGSTVPTKSSAQLTFNSVAGSTYYYDTSQFIAGDFAQFALQKDATALSTNRYAYTATVVDYRVSNTTTTYTGNAVVVSPSDEPFNALGKGWSVEGLNRIYAVTGGVILYSGSGDAQWFATGSSSGGTTSYTSPAGDFSTLTKTDATGVFSRTLKDGTRQEFNSSGYQTATVDLNGLRVTYSYDGSNRLSKITDPYSKVTTFTYSSGKLQSIEDPANRRTTFSFTGSSPTTVTLPDNSSWGYAYDGSGRMTGVTDPRSKTVTIQYDSANRVGTITRPDSSSETFQGYQVRGYDTTGTSGSPAPATLWAEAAAAHTDPRGNTSQFRPDWRGLGTVGQITDANGQTISNDIDANGLAPVTIDRLGRITRTTFNAQGNPTRLTFHDGNSQNYTYNSFSQITSAQDERNNTITYTYDLKGNLTGVLDPLSNRTTMTYTANGRLQTVKDARSNVTSYQYDSQDRLTTITFPGSVTRKFAYDSKGNVATVTDERGNSTTYSYDALNRVTGVKDALSNRNTYTYDSGGNLTKVEEPLSRTTSLAYDSLNRLTTITDPLSQTTVLGYDSGGNLTQVTNPRSQTTVYQYDALNRRTVTTDPLANSTMLAYDAEGQVTTVTDQRGNSTVYTYTSRGWVATIKDPLNKVTTYNYTPTGKPAEVTLPDSGGSAWQYTYDALDRLTSVRDPFNKLTTTAYDAVGNVSARTDANNHTTTYTYDARNRLETVKDALSKVTTFQYDNAGNRTVTIDPLLRRTTIAYDALNRATTITDPLGGVTAIAFDAAGRNTGLTDALSNRTTWTYDLADRVTILEEPDPDGAGPQSAPVTRYSYDSGGNPRTLTDPLGRVTTYDYDALDRRTVTTDPLGRRTTATYDQAGNLRTVTDPNNNTTTYAYDERNRLKTITGPDPDGAGAATSPITTYTYDGVGNLETVTDPNGNRTTYIYDALNRVSRITEADPDGGGPAASPITTYTYDDVGNLRSIIDPNGNRTTYAYDAVDRVTTVTDPNGKVTTHTYDSAGQLVERIDRNNRRTTFAYDSGGRRTAERWLNSGGGTIRTVTYSYDLLGRLTGATDPDAVLTFTYDSLGRPTVAQTSGGGSGQPNLTLTSAYDAVGNRISLADGLSDVGRTTYAYDAADRLTSITQSSAPEAKYFDFGTAGSPLAAGYTRVADTTTYTTTLGYGWSSGTINSADRGASYSDLQRDLNFTTDGSFEVAVADGTYDVTLTVGDAAAFVHDQVAVYLEGAQYDTLSTAASQILSKTYTVSVADGRLTLRLKDLGGTDANATIIALSVVPRVAAVRFDFGGGPIAAGTTGINNSTSYSAATGYGWTSGTINTADRGASYSDLLRDMNFTTDGTFEAAVTSGTYDVILLVGDSAGFAHDQMGVYLEGSLYESVTTAANQVLARTYTVSVADGKLTLRLKDLGGTDANATILGLDIVPRTAATRFDFGTSGSPVEAGTTQVVHTTSYSASLGYGWSLGTISSVDRGSSYSALQRDLNYTTDGTFEVALPLGLYDVTAILGDPVFTHDQMEVYLEGTLVDTMTTTATTPVMARTYLVAVTDGKLTLRLRDNGGSDANATIVGLDIVPRSTVARYDFGIAGSPVATDYTGVTNTTAYGSGQSYGWLSGMIAGTDRGASYTDLERDLNSTADGTFEAAVANGTYSVTVRLGDKGAARDQVAVYLEGAPVDLVSTPSGQVAALTYVTTVADGRLTLRLKDTDGAAIIGLDVVLQPNPTALQAAYTYDAGDRVTALTRTVGGIGPAVVSARAYDALDRLTTLTHQAAGVPLVT